MPDTMSRLPDSTYAFHDDAAVNPSATGHDGQQCRSSSLPPLAPSNHETLLPLGIAPNGDCGPVADKDVADSSRSTFASRNAPAPANPPALLKLNGSGPAQELKRQSMYYL